MTSHFQTYITNIDDFRYIKPQKIINQYNSTQGLTINQQTYFNEGIPMSTLEISFNSQIIIELIRQNNWFPSNVYNYIDTQIYYNYPNWDVNNNWKRQQFVLKVLTVEWCKLWNTHRNKKNQRYITTINNISNSDVILPNKQYLIDIFTLIKQRNDDKKIHNKFIKENNVKLKEKIMKTLDKETDKKNKLEDEIKALEEILKQKKLKVNECNSQIEHATDMKSILIFPGVCKDIYSVFSQNKSKPELIFHNPNDITIRVVEYLKELSN